MTGSTTSVMFGVLGAIVAIVSARKLWSDVWRQQAEGYKAELDAVRNRLVKAEAEITHLKALTDLSPLQAILRELIVSNATMQEALHERHVQTIGAIQSLEVAVREGNP